jgi:hypothetical protein
MRCFWLDDDEFVVDDEVVVAAPGQVNFDQSRRHCNQLQALMWCHGLVPHDPPTRYGRKSCNFSELVADAVLQLLKKLEIVGFHLMAKSSSQITKRTPPSDPGDWGG